MYVYTINYIFCFCFDVRPKLFSNINNNKKGGNVAATVKFNAKTKCNNIIIVLP